MVLTWFSVACFGVIVLVIFHLMFVYYTFSSVLVAEWPPFGKKLHTVHKVGLGGRTGLMVRASDSGSGDPGSILGRVGVFVSLSKRHLLPKSTGNTQE